MRLGLRAPFGRLFYFFLLFFYDICNKLLRIISVSDWTSVRQFYALIRVVKCANLIDPEGGKRRETLDSICGGRKRVQSALKTLRMPTREIGTVCANIMAYIAVINRLYSVLNIPYKTGG